MPDQFCLMRQQTCERSCEPELMEAIPPTKNSLVECHEKFTFMEALARRKTTSLPPSAFGCKKKAKAGSFYNKNGYPPGN